MDLIGKYYKSIKQQHPGGAIVKKYVILTCMTMIDPATVWFETVEVPCFYLGEIPIENNQFLEKYSAGVIQLFTRKLVCRPHVHTKFCLTTVPS